MKKKYKEQYWFKINGTGLEYRDTSIIRFAYEYLRMSWIRKEWIENVWIERILIDTNKKKEK